MNININNSGLQLEKKNKIINMEQLIEDNNRNIKNIEILINKIHKIEKYLIANREYIYINILDKTNIFKIYDYPDCLIYSYNDFNIISYIKDNLESREKLINIIININKIYDNDYKLFNKALLKLQINKQYLLKKIIYENFSIFINNYEILLDKLNIKQIYKKINNTIFIKKDNNLIFKKNMCDIELENIILYFNSNFIENLNETNLLNFFTTNIFICNINIVDNYCEKYQINLNIIKKNELICINYKLSIFYDILIKNKILLLKYLFACNKIKNTNILNNNIDINEKDTTYINLYNNIYKRELQYIDITINNIKIFDFNIKIDLSGIKLKKINK